MSSDLYNPLELIELDALLAEIDQVYKDEPDYLDRLDKFMMECLLHAKEALDEISSAALETARRYRLGLASKSDLDAERARCWKEADSRSHLPESDRSVAGLRAVMFVLYEKIPDGDGVETIGHFLQSLCWARPDYCVYGEMLKSQFGHRK